MDTNNPHTAQTNLAIPCPPQLDSPKPVGLAEVQALIDASASREKEWIKFYQDQVDKDRQYFQRQIDHTKWLVGIVIAVLLFVVSYVGFSSVDQARAKFNESFETALKNQEKALNSQIESFRLSNARTIEDETHKVQLEVREQVNREIEKPSIQQTIDESVRSVAATRVEALVSDQLNPISARISDFDARMRLTTLALNAQAGDRRSFEELRRISRGRGPSADQAANLLSVTVALFRGAMTTGYMVKSSQIDELTRTRSVAGFKAFLLSESDPIRRETAVLTLRNTYEMTDEHQLIPTFVHLVLNDPNLRVVCAAHAALSFDFGLGLQNYKPLEADLFDFDSVRKWWDQFKTHREFNK